MMSNYQTNPVLKKIKKKYSILQKLPYKIYLSQPRLPIKFATYIIRSKQPHRKEEEENHEA
jgi:hypothetical protein